MENGNKLLSTALSLVLFLNGCAKVASPFGTTPAPASGFISAAYVLEPAVGAYPFHRVWESGRKFRAPTPKPLLYVADVDTKHLSSRSNAAQSNNSKRSNLNQDAQKLADYARRSFVNSIKQSGAFQIVDDPAIPGVWTLELALVELTPTDIARNVIGTALSTFVPVAGAVSLGSQGSAGIEGVLSDSSGPVFMFADRERGKLAPFSFNDYTRFSHARDIVDDWAEQFAKLVSTPEGTRVAEKLPFTLLPI